MSTLLLPSFRRQQLVLDFSSLKDNCPEGLYLSLTPGDPSLWAAVLFVHKGPYAGAVLRFQISFPDDYPEHPPVITFSTDIFHPLVVPLTTYTFSTSVVDAIGTVSASDEDRLPPGSFSLRYGFPRWFLRVRSSDSKSDATGGTENDKDPQISPTVSFPGPGNAAEDAQMNDDNLDRRDIILKVLNHVQEAFENDALLDNLPLDTAGDPSAWHAWRAHRGLARQAIQSKSPVTGSNGGSPASPKHPGEWKWDGVWESRVNNGIEASISEATLFGNTRGGRAGSVSVDMATTDPRQNSLAWADRQICFSKLDDERFEELKGEWSSYASTMAL
ncbi:uncharacterized protein Z518_06734 [Rhinocladiella mackenziei CBS 650.93]|uniref:UBC core domain-containing protein n=1 Tax=Rhinocladiella mackenziei CBS 650.93 TaxID=1442369 RepID=A0A0D2FMG3_9EURO|nr:uncharacterized protein Z518_06734 [Rhinocladiella mackenziei CBS 650.93]KIX03182.1 hypothetical protein Z518_06734 [Rhinocladiella mackenziei CBS 650.93]